MDKRKSIFLRILLIIGLTIFFYPEISDYVNSFTQSRAIVEYQKALGQYDGIEKEKFKKEAEDFNRGLLNMESPLLNPSRLKSYEKTLDPFKNGMMGCVIIDKINVNLPIYHGVNEGVIQVGVGHLKGSSLPIGGESTHAVISSHSGLPTARLFTDLHKLELGDEFEISVLGEEHFYQVDQILTVLPKEIEALKIERGEDYVTMFTCTPYGINTHRLLVRGHRIYKTLDKQEVKRPKMRAENSMKGNLLKIIGLILLLVIILITIIVDLVAMAIKRKKYKY